MQVTAFRERPGEKDVIEVDLIVEANSQKGIVIGKGASALKQLGMRARADIEAFLGAEPQCAAAGAPSGAQAVLRKSQRWQQLWSVCRSRAGTSTWCNRFDGLGCPADREVHLELSVRVQPKWRKSSANVTKYGY